uniref:DDT domain-containing protein n=1 Tax=Oryza punctata TaxID=4537 RepID=A0A0E0JEW9_ORYPU
MASPAKRARPSASTPVEPPAAPAPEDPRALLRRSWELASVLHFLRVFEPVIEGNLGLSAEEIETALIANNRDLARIHIALIKGIPPAIKNLKVDDGWITATAKKLSDWWTWVAEGANPFKVNPGNEIDTYKQQDPIKRLLILKALCEVRSEQNDAVWYVNDEMKRGIDISNFRKEKLGSSSNGTLYWYDGDTTIGHRLYSEYVTLDFKRNLKGKDGRLIKPVMNIQWETVATNLDEFVEISFVFCSHIDTWYQQEKLCSKGRAESAIGEHLKAEIIPDVEKLQKKKERDLKRQQKKDELLAYATSFQTRSLRERRPVSYNYSDYDRSIKEAIKAAAKSKESDPQEAGKKEKRVSHQGNKGANGGSDIGPEQKEDGQEDAGGSDINLEQDNLEQDKDGRQEDAEFLDDLSSDEDEDKDYNGKDDDSSGSDGENDVGSDGENDAYDPNKGDTEEEEVFVPRKRTRLATRGLDKPRQGLRRSQRNMKNDEDIMRPGQLTPRSMTKKTMRQRPTSISKQFSLSGSEDDCEMIVADSEEESGSP